MFRQSYSKTVIFNKAMQEGEYLTQIEMAKVIVLYKKEESYTANDYRPINLLSSFDKTIESLQSKRLVKFLDDNNLIFEFLFGFVNYIQQHLF